MSNSANTIPQVTFNDLTIGNLNIANQATVGDIQFSSGDSLNVSNIIGTPQPIVVNNTLQVNNSINTAQGNVLTTTGVLNAEQSYLTIGYPGMSLQNSAIVSNINYLPTNVTPDQAATVSYTSYPNLGYFQNFVQVVDGNYDIASTNFADVFNFLQYDHIVFGTNANTTALSTGTISNGNQIAMVNFSASIGSYFNPFQIYFFKNVSNIPVQFNFPPSSFLTQQNKTTFTVAQKGLFSFMFDFNYMYSLIMKNVS